MEAKGAVRKGDGKDVDHKQALIKGGSNTASNLRVRDANANRSFKRTRNAGMAWGRGIMPYKSEKQRRFMHSQKPEIAKKWDKKYGSKPQPGYKKKR